MKNKNGVTAKKVSVGGSFMSELKTQAARGGLFMGSAMAVSTVMQILQLAILARLLEKTDFGLMAMVPAPALAKESDGKDR